jgi:hypothetical protein
MQVRGVRNILNKQAQIVRQVLARNGHASRRVGAIFRDAEAQILVRIRPLLIDFAEQLLRAIHVLQALVARGHAQLLIAQLPDKRILIGDVHGSSSPFRPASVFPAAPPPGTSVFLCAGWPTRFTHYAHCVVMVSFV